MLVLSRRENERIRLGDSIVVTVVRVAGDRVRLGIEAPPDVLVLRDELPARQAPNALATQPGVCDEAGAEARPASAGRTGRGATPPGPNPARTLSAQFPL